VAAGVSSTRQHLDELVAEHAAADRVQEEVDRHSADVQQLRVVAGDQHRPVHAELLETNGLNVKSVFKV